MGSRSGQEHVHYYIHGLRFNAQLVVGGAKNGRWGVIFPCRYKNEFHGLLKVPFPFPEQYNPPIFIRNAYLAWHEERPVSLVKNVLTF